jgi:anti-sigma regulatory factor (Ser/Thr protein kinase)
VSPRVRVAAGRGYMAAVLPGTQDSPAIARTLIRQLGWLRGEQAESAVTCVSELVTNAVLHTRSGRPGGHLQLTVERHPGDWSVKVGVLDEGTGARLPPAQRPGGEHGRGLAIVEVLSQEWGVTPMYGTARLTWCVLAPTDVRHRSHASRPPMQAGWAAS